MKILHIIPLLHGGGAEKFCIDLCNALAKDNDVTVCALFDIQPHMFMAKALNSNVKIITLNKKLGFDIRMFFKLYKLVKHGEYDIINTHLRALVNALIAILFTKNKFFHTVHSIAPKEATNNTRIIYRLLFRFFNVTPISISEQVRESIKIEYGSQFDTLITNGTKKLEKTAEIENVRQEIENYKKTKNTKVFLTIGRIAEEKNQKMLIKVFNQLLSEGEDIALLIIGDDPHQDKPLLSTLKELACEEVHFLGMKSNISDYLISSDAFCLSSLYEGLPITLIESMSLGIIPICTPAGGIVDVLYNMQNGLLSTDLSDTSYYLKIKEFLSLSEDQKMTLSTNSIKDFENSYDISATAQKYIDLYNKV